MPEACTHQYAQSAHGGLCCSLRVAIHICVHVCGDAGHHANQLVGGMQQAPVHLRVAAVRQILGQALYSGQLLLNGLLLWLNASSDSCLLRW